MVLGSALSCGQINWKRESEAYLDYCDEDTPEPARNFLRIASKNLYCQCCTVAAWCIIGDGA